ncbi:efflux RND transporter periplasmic adaptor subunit [Azoarcus olearius]|uniref:Membrane fusion protein n=1 Tax=Azoarcus sp. (strain BH72) TaxID=418699 RepID=A1KAY6_AZOSB|nr:membrane fusion protein [Azoarcus olearius]
MMIPRPLVLLLSLLIATSSAHSADEVEAIPTVRIGARALASAIVAEASIEAVRQSTLAAQVPGRVVQLAADAGDAVRAGQVLLRIDAAEASQAVAAADADVARAEAGLTEARANLARSRSLFERKFVSQAVLDQAQAAFDAAAAQLRAARAGRGQAASVQGHAAVAAPFAGVIAARYIEAGEMAQPGRELLTLYDPAALRAVVDLPQQRLAQLGTGPVKARIELPGQQRVFEAASVTVLPAADARTHTVRVRVELPPGSNDVVPGTYARVHFLSAATRRLTVPAAAVLRRGELTAVYVAEGRGGFSLRQLRLGDTISDDTGRPAVEVLAGLGEGDVVALDPVQAGIVARARQGK